MHPRSPLIIPKNGLGKLFPGPFYVENQTNLIFFCYCYSAGLQSVISTVQ